MKHLRTLRYVTLCALVLLAAAGCPPIPELTVNREALEFTATDDNLAVSLSFANGELDWTVEVDRPWLSVNTASGRGNGQIQITIDRSLLDPSEENTGTVTIRAGEQEITISVSAVSAFTPVDTAYFPMAVGNSWTYALPTPPGEGVILDTVELSVVDRLTVNGHEVWQVEVRLPGAAMEIPAFKGLPVEGDVEADPSLSTYWVLVDGAWYLGTSRESVDALPDTGMLVSLAKVLELPGALVYAQTTGLLDEVANEITGILAVAQAADAANEEALNAYYGVLLNGETETFFALTNAFGAEFAAYDSGDPVLDALVTLLADTSTGLEPMYQFVLDALDILINTGTELFPLPDPFSSLAYWTAWEARYGDYENADPVVEALVRFSSQTLLEMALLTDAAADFTEEDHYAVSDFFYALQGAFGANVELLANDPAAFVDAMIAFVSDYETNNAAVETVAAATVRILEDLGVLLPVLAENEPFPIDTAGAEAFVADAIDFNTAYRRDNLLDPAAIFMGVLLDGTAQMLDALALVAPTLNTIAADVENWVNLASMRGLADFDLARLQAVLSDFATFFGTYSDTHGDPLAESLQIQSQAGADVLGVIVQLIEDLESIPFEDAAGSLEELLPDSPFAYSLDDFGIPNQEDCISPRVIVTTETETLHFASTIYARDIGPVLLTFLPLQYAVIDGETIGTPPAP